MTVVEAIDILENATVGSINCAVAIHIIRTELRDLRDECESMSVALEKATALIKHNLFDEARRQ